MIRLGTLRDAGKRPNEECWIIVRSLKSCPRGALHVPRLSPALFHDYLEAARSGLYGPTWFRENYVPRFVEQMAGDIEARSSWIGCTARAAARTSCSRTSAPTSLRATEASWAACCWAPARRSRATRNTEDTSRYSGRPCPRRGSSAPARRNFAPSRIKYRLCQHGKTGWRSVPPARSVFFGGRRLYRPGGRRRAAPLEYTTGFS